MRKKIVGILFGLLVINAVSISMSMSQPVLGEKGKWIWHPDLDPLATNQFTYFRKIIDLETVRPDLTVLFAADANARLVVNGQVLRRKVTRYHPDFLRPEKVLIGPYLRPGKNVILILHQNWGMIKNFQRQEKRRGGVLLQCGDQDAIFTDANWRVSIAPEFVRHEQQIIGVIGDLRIRFPVILDGALVNEILDELAYAEEPPFVWKNAIVIENPIWTVMHDLYPQPQREYFFPVQRLLAAGRVEYAQPFDADLAVMKQDVSFPERMETAVYRRDEELTKRWADFPEGDAVEIVGKAGDTFYLTFDFHQPVHGYPVLDWVSDGAGIAASLGYCELNLSPYDGTYHIDAESGKIKTQGVVGKFYGDRYFSAGKGRPEWVEIPDERTARYLTLHITFPNHATGGSKITINRLGMVKSQYSVVWRGSFTCGNLRLEQLAELSKIHAEITMSDTYVDTPGREDGQWLEDIRLRARIAETWFGDSDLRMLTLLHSQECRENGRFLSFAPQSFVKITGWDWGMQWITMLYDEWRWRGFNADSSKSLPSLDSFKETLVDYTNLLLACVDEKGLFRSNNLFADIRVGSHPRRATDVSVIVHCWLIERLRQAITLAQAFGLDDAADKWSDTRGKMIAAFHNHLVIRKDGKISYAADVLDSQENELLGKSQAAQLSAIEAGLFSNEDSQKILDTFFPAPFGRAPEGIDAWNNPTYLYRALNVLSQNGLGERAVAHVLWRCGSYLPFSPTNSVSLSLQGPLGGPLPEYFITHQEMGLPVGTACSGQPGDPTGSHGWASVALLWLHDTLLGVRWNHDANGDAGGIVTIAPNAYGLPFVCGHAMTPKGEVFVNWEPGRMRLEVEIPPEIHANVKLPFGEGWGIVDAPVGAEIQKNSAREFTITGCGKYVVAPGL
jgi:hypothetical protein